MKISTKWLAVPLLVACGSSSVNEPSPVLERERTFINEMVRMYPRSEMTGLQMLHAAYDYCIEIVEGATLDDLYGRIALLPEDQQSIHGSIVDLTINTICVLDENS